MPQQIDAAFIKAEMMKLWKDTFGDSDSYIKMVFDEYFNIDHVTYSLRDGRVEAAMLGVPYYFRLSKGAGCSSDSGCDDCGETMLRGLYLCGLATLPQSRGKGIMSRLIEESNARAYAGGFDFTCLIPSDDLLRNYYGRRGYVNSGAVKHFYYVSGHKFVNEADCLSDNKGYCFAIVDDNSIAYIGEYIGNEISDIDARNIIINHAMSYMYKMQCEYAGCHILHNKDDIKLIFKDAFDSHKKMMIIYECGGDYGDFNSNLDVICKNKCGDITSGELPGEVKGIMIYSEEPMGGCDAEGKSNDIYVQYLSAVDRKCCYMLLGKLSDIYSSSNIKIRVDCNDDICSYISINDGVAIYNDFYIGDNSFVNTDINIGRGISREYYGMVRILRENEILKFIAGCWGGLKKPILVNNEFRDNWVRYEQRSGELVHEEIKKKNISEISPLVRPLSLKELAEIVFQMPDSDHIVGKVFGIRPLPFIMNLMLD